MPTSFPRVLITRTPQVDQMLLTAERQWPGRPTSQLLVNLAERGMDEPPRSSQLSRFPGGRRISTEEVDGLLDDE